MYEDGAGLLIQKFLGLCIGRVPVLPYDVQVDVVSLKKEEDRFFLLHQSAISALAAGPWLCPG